MKPLDECLYYLVRADGGGIPEKDIYFNDALAHIRQKGFANLELRPVEIRALVNAAKRRGRLDELDNIVNQCRPGEVDGYSRL